MITDEMLENAQLCTTISCMECKMAGNAINLCVHRLAKALKEERAKNENNPRVWDGAPEWAQICRLTWENVATQENKREEFTAYWRKLPKTKSRELAEGVYNRVTGMVMNRDEVIDLIEKAIQEGNNV